MTLICVYGMSRAIVGVLFGRFRTARSNDVELAVCAIRSTVLSRRVKRVVSGYSIPDFTR
jgi:hypothetical protein